jgi:phospholipid/cholesterol/gamma-HCH transport system ATP-binding protein
MKNEAQVVVKSLQKSFGKQRVLDGIDLRIQKGESVAILGKSGTGKSVLLKLLIGLQQPDSGSIQIEGQEINGLDTDELNEIRKKIGFLFQQSALYDSMSIEDNVAFPLARHSKMSEVERKKRARELLASVGMKRDLEKLPSQISGGMQKRVGFARALALDPEILLFDEPTSGLDPITASEIAGLISEMQQKRKTTSLVVTHDVRGASEFTDRMVLLNEGKIQAEGTLHELQKSGDEFVIKFLKESA